MPVIGLKELNESKTSGVAEDLVERAQLHMMAQSEARERQKDEMTQLVNHGFKGKLNPHQEILMTRLLSEMEQEFRTITTQLAGKQKELMWNPFFLMMFLMVHFFGSLIESPAITLIYTILFVVGAPVFQSYLFHGPFMASLAGITACRAGDKAGEYVSDYLNGLLGNSTYVKDVSQMFQIDPTFDFKMCRLQTYGKFYFYMASTAYVGTLLLHRLSSKNYLWLQKSHKIQFEYAEVLYSKLAPKLGLPNMTVSEVVQMKSHLAAKQSQIDKFRERLTYSAAAIEYIISHPQSSVPSLPIDAMRQKRLEYYNPTLPDPEATTTQLKKTAKKGSLPKMLRSLMLAAAATKSAHAPISNRHMSIGQKWDRESQPDLDELEYRDVYGELDRHHQFPEFGSDLDHPRSFSEKLNQFAAHNLDPPKNRGGRSRRMKRLRQNRSKRFR